MPRRYLKNQLNVQHTHLHIAERKPMITTNMYYIRSLIHCSILEIYKDYAFQNQDYDQEF